PITISTCVSGTRAAMVLRASAKPVKRSSLLDGGQHAFELRDRTLQGDPPRGLVHAGVPGGRGSGPSVLQLGEPAAKPVVVRLALDELAIDLDRLLRETLLEIELGQRCRHQLAGGGLGRG